MKLICVQDKSFDIESLKESAKSNLKTKFCRSPRNDCKWLLDGGLCYLKNGQACPWDDNAREAKDECSMWEMK